jgi:hypothetical protein
MVSHRVVHNVIKFNVALARCLQNVAQSERAKKVIV